MASFQISTQLLKESSFAENFWPKNRKIKTASIIAAREFEIK